MAKYDDSLETMLNAFARHTLDSEWYRGDKHDDLVGALHTLVEKYGNDAAQEALDRYSAMSEEDRREFWRLKLISRDNPEDWP